MRFSVLSQKQIIISSSLILLSIFVFLNSANSNPYDACVNIYSEVGSKGAIGSGFFISNKGEIVTAYHVIKDTNVLEVKSKKLGMFREVQVISFSEKYDLAILRVLDIGPSDTISFLKLNKTAPSTDTDLRVIGYSLGKSFNNFHCKATSEKFIKSLNIIASDGKPLFNENIDIIQLDLTIHNGLSGAPVISSEGVIGVVSGSYDEGGSIAWAIPSKYINIALSKQLNVLPSDVIYWPKVSLMRDSWSNLRMKTEILKDLSKLVKQFDFSLSKTLTINKQFDEAAFYCFTAGEQLKGFLKYCIKMGKPTKDSVDKINQDFTNWVETVGTFKEKIDDLRVAINKTHMILINWRIAILEHSDGTRYFKELLHGIEELEPKDSLVTNLGIPEDVDDSIKIATGKLVGKGPDGQKVDYSVFVAGLNDIIDMYHNIVRAHISGTNKDAIRYALDFLVKASTTLDGSPYIPEVK